MKATRIGIGLLAVMLGVRYLILLDDLSPKDGTFKSGIPIDANRFFSDLLALSHSHQEEKLLAFEAVPEQHLAIKSQPVKSHSSSSNHTPKEIIFSSQPETAIIPMEYGNTLVVYDPSDPAISATNTNYEDPEDSVPLDHENTVISGMMSFMPRR